MTEMSRVRACKRVYVCVFKGLRGYHISSYYSRLLIHSTAVITETLVEMLRANNNE
jgi:hypothetical protein